MTVPGRLPPTAGIGLRQSHLHDVLARRERPAWLEVTAENVMGEGPAVGMLDAIRRDYAVSVHGVGLSLGSAGGIDRDHLARFKAVCDRFAPALVSEHLAWSIGEGVYLNDLLPVPCDDEALAIVSQNIETVQDALKRPILIENVSAYIGFAHATMSEPEFLGLLATRTGCGVLLDVNNVFVSAHNMGFDAAAWIEALPCGVVGEIHLAGHTRKETPDGPVLIDDHESAVCDEVLALYARAVHRFGRKPTLIEWDGSLPGLPTLMAEASRADHVAEVEATRDAA
jgi:uncharacterized protein (UPF0276 family)